MGKGLYHHGRSISAYSRNRSEKISLFTGRDQMQALTGLFAKQFGTPNYVTHSGLCSVNMATGMIYTICGSFWEFGGPDLARSKLFIMIGTAEDHHSNPMKIAYASSSVTVVSSSPLTRYAVVTLASPMNRYQLS